MLPGAFRQLHADAGRIDASALQLSQLQESVQLRFLFREARIPQFNAHPVPDYVTDPFAHIDDCEISSAANIEPKIERVLARLEVSEILQAIVHFAGLDQFVAEERSGMIARLAAIFLEPLFLVQALAFEPRKELAAILSRRSSR